MSPQQNATSAQNAPVAITKIDKMKLVLAADSVQQQFKNAMGDSSPAFIASLIDLFINDPYLQDCDPNKVIAHALKAAILKLPINKSLGFAYIIAYKGVPEFQMGYKGYVQLAIRSGAYRTLNVDEVYDGEYKLKNKLTGEFDLSGDRKSDTVIGFFSHMELHNGFSKTLYMTVPQVRAHAEKYSKSYHQQGSAWQKEFNAMAKKTLLRNLLAKWGLLTVELSSAMEADDEAAGRVQDEITKNANKTNFADAVVVDNPGQPQQQFEQQPQFQQQPQAQQPWPQNNGNQQQQQPQQQSPVPF